ncbi:MAG: hypothetical protein KDK48_05705 [Chlamydiia bacterium]|nr:hypothetical protein [Chlamydiia bacterium]
MTMHKTIALFGEAQKGAFRKPHRLETLPALVETLGAAPPESRGLELAIRTLYFRWNLIYLRVREEGFSTQDYFEGVWLLQDAVKDVHLLAIAIPGVGSREIINVVGDFCEANQSLLIVTESDFYDYLVA